MKNSTWIISLAIVLFCFQSFSQKSKLNIKPDLDETKAVSLDLGSKDYCSSTYTNITDDSITNVTFNTINNNSGQDGNDSYGDYTNISTGLLAGETYTLSVSFQSGTYTQHVWAWIDWNDNEDFEDLGEIYDLYEGSSTTLTKNITVPIIPPIYDIRMRIIEQYSNDPAPCDPHYSTYPNINNYGETEDYTLHIFSNNYCMASGGCEEYISDVEFRHQGSVAITHTECLGYSDEDVFSYYEIPQNGAGYIKVTNGYPFPADQCGIWVDWNKDDDFDDPNELLSVSGTPGEGPYTAFIIPPTGSALTNYNLRTRIVYDQTPNPCGSTTFGEVEDFHFQIGTAIPCEWNGLQDNNWHNPLNWNTQKVPDATTDVIIQDVPNKCWIYDGTGYCNNITIQNGSSEDLGIYDQELIVNGNMDIHGQLVMAHTDGKITTNGDVSWQSGSSADIQENALIEVHGHWTFLSGANVTMNDGIVSMVGSYNKVIESHEEDCYLNDVNISKTGGAQVEISSLSTEDLHIHGDLSILPGSMLYDPSSMSNFLQGDLINLGELSYVSLIFNGYDQMIFTGSGASTQFSSLTISSSLKTEILGDGIGILNLIIESGQLVTNDFIIFIMGGVWDNQVGPAGFDEGNGTVVFDFWTSEIISDETFNILILSTSDDIGPHGLEIKGGSVICQHYNWSIGYLSVENGGSFTANDLVDDGIYGTYYIDPGGTVNLYQDINTGSYVDLNGELYIDEGTMNVYGGSGISYWPYAASGLISMTEGSVLDFHDQGIRIYDHPDYLLYEGISGGTIRTAGGFWGESSDFSPEHGTLEFYGDTYANIYTTNGCYLNNVIINKSSKGNSKSSPKENVIIDERSGKPLGDGSKSDELRLTDFLDINGDLIIENGFLNSNGYNIQIEGDWLNFVGDAGFIESSGYVIFDDDDNVGSIIHTNETFNNLMLLSTASGIPGLTILDGLEVNVLNSLDLQLSSLNMGFASMINVGGDIFIANEAGLNADDGDNLIMIGGNWTNENDPNTMFEGYWPGSETVIFDGFTDQSINVAAPEETFTNLVINKTSGEFKPNDNIQVLGNLNIQYGDWRDNVPLLSHSFHGDFMIDIDGNYYPEYETCFKGESDQVYETFGGDGIFKKLVIDKTPAKNSFGYKGGGSKSMTLTLNSDMVVHDGYSTLIEEGNFFLNGHLFNPTSHMYIENGSALIVNEGAVLVLSSGLFMNGGELITYGSPGNEATVTKGAAGEYQFEVRSGASISSNFTKFEGMNGNGIWVQNGAFVNPANAFNNCIFGAGDNLSGSIRLTINNDQALNLDNVSFIDNPYVTGSINVGKFYEWGELGFTNFSGDFAGSDYESDQFDKIFWHNNEYRLELKVFLEGPFNGTAMNTDINPVLPLDSPFDPQLPYFGNPMPDWYYASGGSVGFIPNTSVVDWVLVQLRDASSAATALPATNIATTPAFVMDDGSIIALDGSAQLSFEIEPINDLYVVIWHRNHLGVISANPLVESGDFYTYNFFTSASQVYGGATAQVQLSSVPVIWGMMAGDGNGNGLVSFPDITDAWNIQTGNAGYLESDYNMNGQVGNQDKNDKWVPNQGSGSYIPE